jgi:hypothetical protein
VTITDGRDAATATENDRTGWMYLAFASIKYAAKLEPVERGNSHRRRDHNVAGVVQLALSFAE